MNIVVFGANGRTGRLMTKQALAEGYAVRAVTRHPQIFPFHHEHLQVLRGDVCDPTLVEQVVAGQDAVLSTLGVPLSRKPIALFSQGATHVIQAMHSNGMRRLVCVSSSATDSQTRYLIGAGSSSLRNFLKPIIIATIGRTEYADLWRMETLVRNSQIDWTIVRPSDCLTHQRLPATGWLKTSSADDSPPG